MEIQIKKAIKAGNSSAVILPRSWLDKEVRIELIRKTPDILLSESLDILKKHIELSEIIGIYLVGSYAREDEDRDSDIDILVITRDIHKGMIKEGIYNILIVSSPLLEKKLRKDLFPLGQMIKEAKPLLNSSYIENIDVKITAENVRWHLNTTQNKLVLIKKIIEKMKSRGEKCQNDKIVYTIVLRIRTLLIIKKLIGNNKYSKKEFIGLIKKITGSDNVYARYLAVKNNLKEECKSSIGEIEKLYEYLKNLLAEVNELIKKHNK